MAESKGLTFAFPSGKSMQEPTLALFEAAHIKIDRPHSRLCTANVSGLPGIDRVAFFKPSQIPALVSAGDMALGITGHDALLETEERDNIATIVDLRYSRATAGLTRCVIFARDETDASLEALNDAEIISEYPNETRIFLEQHGISATIVPCSGSAESFVAIGRYKFGVTLTETGTSLRVNDLKEVAEVFASQMVLIANGELYRANSDFRDSADFLGSLLWGVLDARGKVYLLMNAPASRVEEIRNILPALRSPTVQPLADPAYCSIGSVVPTSEINELKRRLKELGAGGFVELDPGSVM